MKIRRIRLNNVRRFVDPVEIADIGDGLNVLTAPNEHGKSTFFDALHAAFFLDRKSWNKEIRALVPHSGGNPSVFVEIELAEGMFQIKKSWNSRNNGRVEIYSRGRLIKQADDAQVWINTTFKSSQNGGPAGLLWVRQGKSGLDEGGDTKRAKRDLLTSVTGEVENITGGRRMDRVLDKCKHELDIYVTSTGQPRRNGPLAQKQKSAAKAREDCNDLEEKCDELHDQLRRRWKLRRELSELEDSTDKAARKDRLEKAESDYEEAKRHSESLERAQEIEKRKRAELKLAQKQLDDLKSDLSGLDEAKDALTEAMKQENVCISKLEWAKPAVSSSEDSLKTAEATAKLASATLQKAYRIQASAATEEQRKELNKRLKDAEIMRQLSEDEAANAKNEISESDFRILEQLDQELQVLQKIRKTRATTITMQYEDGREGRISFDDTDLPDGQPVPILDSTELKIEKLGHLVVSPAFEEGNEKLEECQKELNAALNAAEVQNMDEAIGSNLRRQKAEELVHHAQATFKGIAPDGIDALKKKLASLPEPVEEPEGFPTVEEAKKVSNDANAKLEVARIQSQTSSAKFADADKGVEVAAAAVVSAKAQLKKFEGNLASIEDIDAEIDLRQQKFRKSMIGLSEATQEREAIAASAPDLDAAETALKRAQSVIENVRKEKQRIDRELIRLDATIDQLAGSAVEEELADVRQRAADADRALEELTFEVDVLRKLKNVLEDARETERDRYLEPVLIELKPLINLLWPAAGLRFDPDTVLPTALEREGEEESFEILSSGTQEQIALLVRLAFARLLARGGTSAPVILDDAIVFTDDDRIELMFDALTRQARDLQIIVLSCRQRAFRNLGGHLLEIVPACGEA